MPGDRPSERQLRQSEDTVGSWRNSQDIAQNEPLKQRGLRLVKISSDVLPEQQLVAVIDTAAEGTSIVSPPWPSQGDILADALNG